MRRAHMENSKSMKNSRNMENKSKKENKSKNLENKSKKSSKTIIEKIKSNHFLIMAICCGVPLILLLAATYFFGLNKAYLVWFMVLLCPLMHYFMMRDMHKDTKDKGKKEKRECH